MSKIENTMFNEILPVNAYPMIERLKELLQENQTNSLAIASVRDFRIQQIMWLLNSQVFGQLASIDMTAQWSILKGLHDKYNSQAK